MAEIRDELDFSIPPKHADDVRQRAQDIGGFPGTAYETQLSPFRAEVEVLRRAIPQWLPPVPK